MTFTPHPNTGSAWWVRRLRVAAERAARRRDMAAFTRRPRGPLLRTPTPGEAMPGMPTLLSLTPSERARTRTAPDAPPLAQAIVGQLADTPVGSGTTTVYLRAAVGEPGGPVIATSNKADVYNPAPHDPAPHDPATHDPATHDSGDADDSADGGVR